MLRLSRYWSLGRAPKPTLADNMSGFDNRLRVEKRDWSSLFRPRGQLSGSGWRGRPEGPRIRHRLHPKEPQAAPGPCRWTGGSPASSYVVVVCPTQPMESRREGSGRASRLSTSLGQDRNGSLRSRHLLPTLALLAAANPNSVLNAQEIEAFSQVQTVRNPAVASS